MSDIDDEYNKNMAMLGRAALLSQRSIARSLGMKVLPGYVIYVEGNKVLVPDEELTILLPGEEP